jgi:hypothetical protein
VRISSFYLYLISIVYFPIIFTTSFFSYNTGIKYKELEETEKPFEYIELRKQFIAEICNYNPSFGDKKTEEVLLSLD